MTPADSRQRIRLRAVVSLVAGLGLFAPVARVSDASQAMSAAPTARTASPTAELLPPNLRSDGKAILAEKDEKRRGKLAGALAEDSPDRTARFLVALADTDPSPLVRTE